MLEEAKLAANAGDLALADALLQDVARLQEAELGPIHPELANTINNLAIVAEMEGRFGDAETYYRQAVAIASAALPADDPMVASSRKHLEDFCRDHGLPLDLPIVVPALEISEHGSGGIAAHDPTPVPENVVEVTAPDVAAQPSRLALDTQSVPDPTTDAVERSSAPAATTTPSVAIVAIGLVVLVAIALLVIRPWSSREPVPEQNAPAAAPQAAEPAPARPAGPAPVPSEQAQSPKAASRDGRSGAPPNATGHSSGDMSLVTAQLCRNFSAGGNWRCDPADQSVAPGPIVLYTRVKSPHEAVLIHRWYQGDTLRKTARLTVGANTTDGYRTYSRQTVRSGEDWRVEVRNTAGDVLYEQRVSVR